MFSIYIKNETTEKKEAATIENNGQYHFNENYCTIYENLQKALDVFYKLQNLYPKLDISIMYFN